MNETLNDLCSEWKAWKENADHSENGWQSDFEKWSELMTEAKTTMLSGALASDDLHNLEFCWQISEEEEVLSEFAKVNIFRCEELLEILSNSNLPEVRWQVYEAIASSPRKGEKVLRIGIKDSDPYCRRRAILALVRLRPENIPSLKRRFSADPDLLIRRMVESLVPCPDE